MKTFPFLHCAVCPKALRLATDQAPAAMPCPVRETQGLWGWPCTPSQADFMPPLTREETAHARRS